MAIIEENVDDCGTGMENIKVLLRDPQRKQFNPNVDSKESLDKVSYHKVTKPVPSTVDVLQSKKNRIIRESVEVTK